jgi:hypothetical protein
LLNSDFWFGEITACRIEKKEDFYVLISIVGSYFMHIQDKYNIRESSITGTFWTSLYVEPWGCHSTQLLINEYV